MFRKLVGLFLVISSLQVLARGKIELRGALKDELNKVLEATDEMHGALFSRDEPKIAAKTKGLLQHIERAQERSSLAADQKTHLEKMLAAAKDKLEITQISEGLKRQESLKEAFKQLVQIAKVYKLDSYRIYYCPKDDSVWLQKSSEPKNPINPVRHANCGQQPRR